MVSGQLRLVLRQILLMTHYTTAPTRELTFPAGSVQQVPSGILLRVVATTMIAVSTVLAAMAAIGLLLLTVAARASWTSATVATSIRRTTTLARTATQFVVSKNNF